MFQFHDQIIDESECFCRTRNLKKQRKIANHQRKFQNHAINDARQISSESAITAWQLILSELYRLHFKRRNNSIERKRFWMRQFFMERHSKGELHVLVNELKVFNHEFFFKKFRITFEKLENFLTMVAPQTMFIKVWTGCCCWTCSHGMKGAHFKI